MQEDTIIYVVRLLCFLLLVAVLVMDLVNVKLKNPQVQIMVAIIIMFVFVFIDPLSGFFLACSIFVMYYKLFNQNGQGLSNFVRKNEDKKEDDTTHFGNYITPEHLNSAQDNVISDMNNEITPFDNFDQFNNNTNATVYGAQGLSTEMPGYNYSYTGAELAE